MKSFRFHLERVFNLKTAPVFRFKWRRAELELERARFQLETQERCCNWKAGAPIANMGAAWIRSEIEVGAWHPLEGRDLTALAAFRRHFAAREKEIDARRGEARRKLERRQTAMIEARRRSELLERLEQRRFTRVAGGSGS